MYIAAGFRRHDTRIHPTNLIRATHKVRIMGKLFLLLSLFLVSHSRSCRAHVSYIARVRWVRRGVIISDDLTVARDSFSTNELCARRGVVALSCSGEDYVVSYARDLLKVDVTRRVCRFLVFFSRDALRILRLHILPHSPLFSSSLPYSFLHVFVCLHQSLGLQFFPFCLILFEIGAAPVAYIFPQLCREKLIACLL